MYLLHSWDLLGSCIKYHFGQSWYVFERLLLIIYHPSLSTIIILNLWSCLFFDWSSIEGCSYDYRSRNYSDGVFVIELPSLFLIARQGKYIRFPDLILVYPYRMNYDFIQWIKWRKVISMTSNWIFTEYL